MSKPNIRNKRQKSKLTVAPAHTESSRTHDPDSKEGVVITEGYSGPIPPPNALRLYEDILEGSANRIITMAENQSSHRQRMEAGTLSLGEKELDAKTRDKKRERVEILIG